jgi:hypothetical protein
MSTTEALVESSGQPRFPSRWLVSITEEQELLRSPEMDPILEGLDPEERLEAIEILRAYERARETTRPRAEAPVIETTAAEPVNSERSGQSEAAEPVRPSVDVTEPVGVTEPAAVSTIEPGSVAEPVRAESADPELPLPDVFRPAFGSSMTERASFLARFFNRSGRR